MSRSNFELLQMQVKALYVHDVNQRLVRINESNPDDAVPHFFLARTATHNLWRFRYDLPNELVDKLNRLANAEPVMNNLREQPYYELKYEALLRQYMPLCNKFAGPAYYLPEFDLPPDAVIVTQQNMGLLQANFPYTFSHFDERTPVVVVIEDGVAIAASYTVRSTPQVAEVGVYTLDAYRGYGYAVETVRVWANAIRAIGKIPLYSTSWDNIASQSVAKKLGAVQYAVAFSIA